MHLASPQDNVAQFTKMSNALGTTGKGTANYFMVIGIVETVALFTLVFSLLLLQ